MANWNANINSYQKQADQMTQMAALCERRDDVFRYAWFIGRGFDDRFSNIFNPSPGELNDLGNGNDIKPGMVIRIKPKSG